MKWDKDTYCDFDFGYNLISVMASRSQYGNIRLGFTATKQPKPAASLI